MQKEDLILAELKRHGVLLDKSVARFDKIDETLESIDSRFERIDVRFEKIDARFEKIDTKLKEHDEKFEEFGAILDEHSVILSEHSVALEEIKEKMVRKNYFNDVMEKIIFEFRDFKHEVMFNSKHIGEDRKQIEDHEKRIIKLEGAIV